MQATFASQLDSQCRTTSNSNLDNARIEGLLSMLLHLVVHLGIKHRIPSLVKGSLVWTSNCILLLYVIPFK